MNCDQVRELFDRCDDVWKEWSWSHGYVTWTDHSNVKHEATDIKQIEQWLENHSLKY